MGLSKDSADAKSYAEALQQLTRRYEGLVQTLSILRQIDAWDDPTLDMDQLCCKIVETIAFGLAVKNCSLMLRDGNGQFLELRAACGPFEDEGKSFAPGTWHGKHFRLGEGIVGKVAQTGRLRRVDDTALETAFIPSENTAVEIRSLLCLPLSEEEKTIGVLNLSHSKPEFFDPDSENTLTFVAERVSRILTSHRLHQRLRESEEHYRLVAEHAGDGIFVLNRQGRVVSANPAIERMTGVSSTALNLEQYDWQSKVHDEDRESFASHLAAVVDCQLQGTIEYRRLDTSGAVHHFEQHSSPLLSPEGHVKGAVCVVRDRTEYRKAEEAKQELTVQLRQAQKMEAVGQLAGGVAHDFNNLLQAILGYTDLAMLKCEPGAKLCKDLERVHHAAERAMMLTRQLLAFSRRQTLDARVLDLNEVIDKLIDMIRRVIGEDIELEVLSCPDPVTIHADRSQIEQVLMNLCVNARDAMPKGGVITIETTRVELDGKDALQHEGAKQEPLVMLRMTDTGCGMDKDTLNRVFEPFFTTKGVDKGTGLGLSTVYGIVQQHQGRVEVDSQPHVGTTFRIFLPFTNRPSGQITPQASAQPPTGSETILVAEDDAAVRALVREILEEAGYTAIIAEDGEDALRLFDIHAEAVDLLLFDAVMPKLGGRAAVEKILAKCPQQRFLFASGYSDDTLHMDSALDEGLPLIRKPFGREGLLEKVREVLDCAW